MMSEKAIEKALSRLDAPCRALYFAITGQRRATSEEKYLALAAVHDETLPESEERLIENRSLFAGVRMAVKLAAEAKPQIAERILRDWAMDIASNPT